MFAFNDGSTDGVYGWSAFVGEYDTLQEVEDARQLNNEEYDFGEEPDGLWDNYPYSSYQVVDTHKKMEHIDCYVHIWNDMDEKVPMDSNGELDE